MIDMHIDDMIQALTQLKEEHGNIPLTCTGSTLQESDPSKVAMPDVFESTVCNLFVVENDVGALNGKRVKISM